MWTAAQQVFHAGSGINWFREGTFGTGFRAAHEAHEGDEATAQSLNKAVDHFNGAFDLLIDELRNASDVDLQKPLPPDAPMTGRVRDVVSAVIDHTAHHRGAIQTYVRLLGKEPVSPYKQKTGAGNRPENVPHI
jgi:uncharacterized damage-inducible protein DinB